MIRPENGRARNWCAHLSRTEIVGNQRDFICPIRALNRALAGSLAKRMARTQKPLSIHALLPELKRRKARCLPSGEGMPQISVKKPGSRRRIVGLPLRST